MKTTIGSVCFIKDVDKNKILFLKRNKEPMSDMYTGVGGKTEPDEDIYESCIREVKEETGLIVYKLKLEGVVKTILQDADSSWILFIYTANEFGGEIIDCNEGDLEWLNRDEVDSKNLIGFIREMLSAILDENKFIEGTIWHDIKGNVLKKELH